MFASNSVHILAYDNDNINTKMVVETASVNVYTLILSSAVVSALINVAWNAFARFHDRRAAAKKMNHVYLSIALQLEDFACRCNAQIYDINEAVSEYHEGQSTAFQKISPFKLEFTPEPEWTSLPVKFVAEIKSLSTRFEQCNSWIIGQFNNGTDADDTYALEEERLAYYALRACVVATSIRARIGAGTGDIFHLINNFEHVIERSRSSFLKYADSQPFIPELRAQFDSAASQNGEACRLPALSRVLSSVRAAIRSLVRNNKS